MSEAPREPGADRGADASPEPGEDSILGSLPRSRPGVRSPRRDAAAKARAARTPKSAQASAGGDPPEPQQDSGNLEDLAHAGATTAIQVATAGLKFAGRAAGAIRESLERR